MRPSYATQWSSGSSSCGPYDAEVHEEEAANVEQVVREAALHLEPLGDAPDDSTVGGISLGDDLEGTDSRTKIDPGGDPSTGEPLI